MAPLCREYQIDWLIETIKKYIKSEIDCAVDKETLLKYLAFSDEMDFGPSVVDHLINAIRENFPSLHMSLGFMSLSSKMQILIARKRLWLLLRNFNENERRILLNKEDCGFLSIFEGQKVFNFEYNNAEKYYLEKCGQKETLQ